ncbi:MAG TPA: hypothetical protein VKA82_21605 [Rubrobacter sp.]|nr:hypothetical protein [Rubrobacter sp.]
MTPAHLESRLAPDDVRPWRLGARARKAFLVAHIASAGAWIGIVVAMGVRGTVHARPSAGSTPRPRSGRATRPPPGTGPGAAPSRGVRVIDD